MFTNDASYWCFLLVLSLAVFLLICAIVTSYAIYVCFLMFVVLIYVHNCFPNCCSCFLCFNGWLLFLLRVSNWSVFLIVCSLAYLSFSNFSYCFSYRLFPIDLYYCQTFQNPWIWIRTKLYFFREIHTRENIYVYSIHAHL